MMLRSVKMSGFILLALMAGILSGCAAGGDLTVGPDDDGGTVAIERGAVLTVELPGNPTTGYTWGAYNPPSILEQRGEPTFEPESDALGAGGMVTAEFEAVEVGTGTLELWYARPWESKAPEQTFTVEVTVK